MKLSTIAIATLTALSTTAPVLAESLGTAKLDLRLRYEAVNQDNAAKDADALTLRTRLTFTTVEREGFSGVVEFEDSRQVLAMSDYNDTNGQNSDHSVIADPETTELDQGYLKYKNAGLTAKLGRQVLTFDNHRFVGHVGWRQDRQTFDGVTVNYAVNEDFTINYGYLTQRNRIFGDQKDLDAKDHLFNASYKIGSGKLVGYGYLLEVDSGTDNSLDTFGAYYQGKVDMSGNKVSYRAEIASQTSETPGTEYEAMYYALEAGIQFGGVTTKLGYESLGSDDGQFGFSTPLATLHKFNGWTDQFLGTPAVGLNDAYITVAGKALNGKWAATYHSFSADESTNNVDDLGNEIDLVFSTKFGENYNAGVKYAYYQAGDTAAGKVDTDKVWLWLGATF